MPVQWITDSYVEFASDETENFSSYWYGDVLKDANDQEYVHYDANQTPPTIYPPDPPKVRPPAGPSPIRPPSAPPIDPPAPRVRRTKGQPLPY